jgi:catalase
VMGKPIRNRMLGQLANVDPKIAQRVAAALGHRGPIDSVAANKTARTDLKASPALSIQKKSRSTLDGRMIGCLVADGTDAAMVSAAKAEAQKAGATFKVVAPTVEGAMGNSGQQIDADLQLAGGPSVLFDTVIVVLTADAAQKLSMQPAAVGFVADAYSHLKVIGFSSSAQPLLTKAGVMPDEGVIELTSGAGTFITQAAKGRIWAREPKVRPVH